MLKICKVRADHVIDYAAEEMKKYLRMMMPEAGDVEICYDPEAVDGFRLGLLEDFGLPSEIEDPVLDDVIHVETTETAGILAGSNPRSVLFSVYRFFRENGCRWLYPGVDGDYVPLKPIEAVSYHKKADHRFRGFCNEGSESQTCMLECADYYAKLEMNVFMLEWFIPANYYNRYYSHINNTANRIPETLTDEQILQWKRMCETEIAKRGLMFHDIGHGWTARPFGIPYNPRPTKRIGDWDLTEEQRSILAMRDGKREIFRNSPLYTNICMSRPDVRTAMVREVCDYAETHRNVDYLHVWLADNSRNHCECEECSKMRPSDWYMMIMNELDEELTRRGLDTRIVFIAYVDTMFAPEKVFIKNPKRFSLLYAPVSRSYTESIDSIDDLPEPTPYIRNQWKNFPTLKHSFAHIKAWREHFKGMVFSYEYHFWRHQFLDVGGLALAKRLYEDVRSLRVMKVDGYVQDGSQRSGFPNAFPVYIYAEALMNRDCDYEAVRDDYFEHIYGPDYEKALSVLTRITDAFDFAYMEGERSEDPNQSKYFAPSRVSRLQAVYELAAEERSLAEQHLAMPTRPQTVSWRLLLIHAEYCELWAEIMIAKANGYDHKAKELAEHFKDSFGRHEIEFERYYDHCLACRVLEQVTGRPKSIIIE